MEHGADEPGPRQEQQGSTRPGPGQVSDAEELSGAGLRTRGGARPGLPGSASRAADSDCDQGRVNVFGGKKLITAEVLDADEKEGGTWRTKEKGKAP